MTSNQTYLGFDFGVRKIGIAVGQCLTGAARDLDTVRAGQSPDWDRITRHVADWQPCALVIGLPLSSGGDETDMSRRARKFGRLLADRYNLPIHWVNEYLTSAAARQALSWPRSARTRRKQDQVAARIILETFLNQQHC